ncbi:hypothetical protein ES707_22369 [subsurface metagenome]
MKWLKVLIALAEIFIPGLAKFGMNGLTDELGVAQQTINILSKDLSPDDKSRAVLEAVGKLKMVEDFNSRLNKKIDKAKVRLLKKLF